MKKELIKISSNHFVFVDDSEIKEFDCIYDLSVNIVGQANKIILDVIKNGNGGHYKKVTHSTQPIEIRYIEGCANKVGEVKVFENIKHIDLEEIKLLNNPNMEDKDFLIFEQSKELKKLNFKKHYYGYFNEKGKFFYTDGPLEITAKNSLYDNRTPAPLFQQAFEFFEEEMRFYFEVYPDFEQFVSEAKEWFYIIKRGLISTPDKPFKSRHEAKLACIDKLIELSKSITPRQYTSPLIDQLLSEITPEEMEETGKRMQNQADLTNDQN